MDKMNPEIKAEWVTVLRSGEYQQGRNTLRTIRDEYCCLGVLSDLFIKATGNGEWEPDGTCHRLMVDGEGYDVTPPKEVSDWAGLDSRTAPYRPLGTLIGMNDTSRESFSTIADWIEENL